MRYINFILNKLTLESYKKLDDTLKGKKEKIESEILSRLNQEPQFREKFLKFYHNIEIGGRKHFFILKHIFSEEERNNIQRFIERKEILKRENINLFDELKNLEKDKDKIIVSWHEDPQKGLFIQFRQIKKWYKEEKTEIKGDKLIKIYSIKPIHHITFINCNFDKNLLIIGVDTYKNLFPSLKQIHRHAFDTFERVSKRNVNNENLITHDVIDGIIREGNVIVNKLKGSIFLDEGVFKKKEKYMKKITEDLKSHRYSVDEVKKYNIDIDIFSHTMFEDSYNKAIERGQEIFLEYADIYWFTNVLGIPTYFRVALDVKYSSITTYASHVFEQEIYDLISECVTI